MSLSLIPSPPQPAPIGAGTYTTWPGGVDPTARLFNTDNTDIPCTGTKGGRRRASRKSRKSRKIRKTSRKVSRKSIKSRKNRCYSRKSRK